MLDPKYEALINAIENGNYADARQELDKLMSKNGSNDNNNQETECTHNYVENYKNEPRCTRDGEISYSCSKCRHSYTEKLASLGHRKGIHLRGLLYLYAGTVTKNGRKFLSYRFSLLFRTHRKAPIVNIGSSAVIL